MEGALKTGVPAGKPLFSFKIAPLEGCLVPVVLRKRLGLKSEAISCVLLK